MRRLDYKYIVGAVFVIGLFMDLLDMTIVNVALPTFVKDFDASTTTIEWVVTGYLLSLGVFIPVSGWAGDRFGTKRTFMFALSMFTLASLLCSLAWNIQALIAFRVLQGVGGGMLTPVGTAMLFRAFPPAERAAAAALLAIPTTVAPASGPVLGGYLVEYQSWHWIFLINIPVGLTGLLVAFLFLREEKQPNPGRLGRPGFPPLGRGPRHPVVRPGRGRLAWIRRHQGAGRRPSRTRPPRHLLSRRATDGGAADRCAPAPRQPVQSSEHRPIRGVCRLRRRALPASSVAPGGDGIQPPGVGPDHLPPGHRRGHNGAAGQSPLQARRAASTGHDRRRPSAPSRRWRSSWWT